MAEVVLFIKGFDINSTIYVCRICHEEEFESCKSLESPCACSGTVKFAHRDCIQRWCDEKGNTICEICLQKFEPGYTTLPKKCQLVNTVVAASEEGSNVPRRARRLRDIESLEANLSEYSSATDWTANCCRKITLTITVLLLLRHIFDTIAFGTEDCPFTLATLLLIRATGIVLPMYLIIRAITAVQNSIKRLREESVDMMSDSDSEDNGEEQHYHHITGVQT